MTTEHDPLPADAHGCLTVVVPCFNEARTIEALLAAVLAEPTVGEIVVVDDASSDESVAIVSSISDERIRLLTQSFNMGKGAAIARGIDAATRPYLVIQDADLEYDPREYPRLLQPLLDGRADVTYGSRFAGDGARRVLYYWHTVGNRILTTASNAMTNLNLTDMETCYKMGRTEVMQSLRLEEDRFGVEPEMTAKLAKAGVAIFETGISYNGRTYAEGKKINWKDGVSAFRCIAKYNRPGRVGFPSADEIDQRPMNPELEASLETLDDATNYNGMIADLIAPWLGDSNVDLGAGFGTITDAVLRRGIPDSARITAADPDADNAERMTERFGDDPRVTVRQAGSELLDQLHDLDCIWMVNVLEHIRDDRATIAKCRDALGKGGRVVLYVPAGRALYSETDKALGHYRRYTSSSLRRVLAATGMRPLELRYVNAPGAMAWWALTKKLGRQPIDGPLVRTYDSMVVPAIRTVESRIKVPFGQSLFCVAEAAN